MATNIKITALSDITSANMTYNDLLAVVDMNGTPETKKSSVQLAGNLILSGAGGSNFVAAAVATLAGSVTNAAQANITSVGTLTSANVTGNLDAGNVNATTAVVATYFSGDGANLTNLPAGSNSTAIANGTSNVHIPASAGNVNTSVGGVANILIVTNSGANVTGTLNATGIITGVGSGISALAGANVTGTVPLATLATSATTANAVALANVSGAGNIASINIDGVASNILYGNGVFAPAGAGSNSAAIANGTSNINIATADGSATIGIAGTAGVVTISGTAVTVVGGVAATYVSGDGANLAAIAGANVTGAVTFAGTANAVAGANVSGAINLATFAGTANAVAGANVSGAINLATFAGTANAVAGANVSGTVPLATSAGTITTAAQPNITSTGTLTALSVTGNVGAGNVNAVGIVTQTSNSVAFGNTAGSTGQGDKGTAVGYQAGQTSQGIEATAIGLQAGRTSQGNAAVAIGSEAGEFSQGFKAVAIGSEAGESNQGNYSVAVGEGAGETYQSTNSVAIGNGAGSRYQGVVGSATDGNAIAIGTDAGRGLAYFPTYLSGDGTTTLVVDSTVGILPQMFIVGTGYTSKQRVVTVVNDTTLTMSAVNETTPSGTMSFYAPQNNGSVAIGLGAGGQDQQNDAVAIGYYAGERQDDQAIAIGNFAGQSGVVDATFVSLAGTTLTVSAPSSSIRVGMVITGTGFTAGQTIVTKNSNTEFVISAAAAGATGTLLFTGTPQGSKSIAIGQYTGQFNQARDSIAIGHEAGGENQGQYAVAIGRQCADNSQGQSAIAIGYQAGTTSQGANSIAIGNSAGTTSQAASSIVINATGVTLNNTTVSSIKIDPVRNDVANIAEVVMYNTTSKEVTYGNTISVAGNITASYNIATTALKTTPTTVAALPAAATAGAGARSFVSDANDTAFNAVVAGGSANNIPVFSDGTTWRIG